MSIYVVSAVGVEVDLVFLESSRSSFPPTFEIFLNTMTW